MIQSDHPLANYLALRDRVDAFARRVVAEYGDSLACRAGCDSCCRHLTLFPVEAHALNAALQSLPAAEQVQVRDRAKTATPAACPLLAGGVCLLYAARPLICRSHGLPLLVLAEGIKSVDYCPLNFAGVATLPGWAVLDLEQLNAALAAVNALFVREVLAGKADMRLTIAEALLLPLTP